PSHRSATERCAAVAGGHRIEKGAGSQHAVARFRVAAGHAALQRNARPSGAAVCSSETAHRSSQTADDRQHLLRAAPSLATLRSPLPTHGAAVITHRAKARKM